MPGTFGFSHMNLRYTVLCEDGFYGPLCNVSCPCSGRDCKNCLLGYTNRKILWDFVRLWDCAGEDCSGNWKYVESTPCLCDPGFTGMRCKNTIDHCHHNQCINGHCVNLRTSYNCTCMAGFSGPFYDVINHCAGNNCTSNSHCISYEDTYVCRCSSGYMGTNCTISSLVLLYTQ